MWLWQLVQYSIVTIISSSWISSYSLNCLKPWCWDDLSSISLFFSHNSLKVWSFFILMLLNERPASECSYLTTYLSYYLYKSCTASWLFPMQSMGWCAHYDPNGYRTSYIINYHHVPRNSILAHLMLMMILSIPFIRLGLVVQLHTLRMWHMID